ncbi:MAG: hypothetical protein AB7N80_05110 [Bdellovibrionales bacterium]
MSRELNPELFPDLPRTTQAGPEPRLGGSAAMTGRDEEWRLLVTQVDFMRRKFKEFEARLELTSSRLNEFANATKLKFERLNGVTQRLDEMVKAGLQDLNGKQSQLISKVNERKVGDAKIQELVDRHNQLVQSFELRLGQMQKLISEQEMQLMGSRTELKEAQREIARMKRL